MTFRKWILELFKDERGAVSIKPVVAFIGTLVLCTTMLINALAKKTFVPSPDLVNAIMIITSVGMGADTFDKFSKRKPATNDDDSNTDGGDGKPTT